VYAVFQRMNDMSKQHQAGDLGSLNQYNTREHEDAHHKQMTEDETTQPMNRLGYKIGDLVESPIDFLLKNGIIRIGDQGTVNGPCPKNHAVYGQFQDGTWNSRSSPATALRRPRPASPSRVAIIFETPKPEILFFKTWDSRKNIKIPSVYNPRSP